MSTQRTASEIGEVVGINVAARVLVLSAFPWLVTNPYVAFHDINYYVNKVLTSKTVRNEIFTVANIRSKRLGKVWEAHISSSICILSDLN